MTLEYLLTSMIVILLPGPGVLYTLAYGLSKGWRASILAAFGCTFGIVPSIAASVVGLAALLHASALAFQIIKYLGVAYLFYMAWGTLRSGGALQISEQQATVPPTKIVVNGFLLNIFNPKLSIFFLAFLPQFVPANIPNPTSYMLGLAAIFMLLTFIVFVGYGAFASATRRYVISRPGIMLWLRRGFAGAFGLLGLKLAIAHQ
ncbi:LysE family translocator [Rhizobium tubonense]|uniref:Lysine transporter LysE n=1 Tax=Rhizobium tubonense TaxID=484088 RepID=A0A2W4CJE1_9HYPH|nr:LysE family translocator [Rhizobium tubonense]PZM13042.1 lysine transporter LysE [Rhizobium tubonense]